MPGQRSSPCSQGAQQKSAAVWAFGPKLALALLFACVCLTGSCGPMYDVPASRTNRAAYSADASSAGWFLSDYFKTSSTWGGHAPINMSAARPVDRVNILHLDKNGPMFAECPIGSSAQSTDTALGAQNAKRSRRWLEDGTAVAADHGGNNMEEEGWVEYVDADESFAAALGFNKSAPGCGVGGSFLNVPPLEPSLSPAELMTMLKACSGDARDLLKILNIVPGDPKLEQQLQLAIKCRARLIVAYFRQRLVEVPESSQAGWTCDGQQAKMQSKDALKTRLVRMDEALPALFNKLDKRLDLQDGLVTMWQPVDETGAPITKINMQGAIRAGECESAVEHGSRVRPPPQLREGKWSAVPVLVPIEDSPYAPTRQVDRRLWAAADLGDPAEVEAALSSGARVNSVAPRIGRWAALHLAAYKGHADVIKCLVARGANVSLPNLAGCMPLHIAAARGGTATVDELVRAGAPIQAVNMDCDTPLHLAAANGHVETARRLVALGASVFMRNAALRTPSEVAAKRGIQYDRQVGLRNESHASSLLEADQIRQWRENVAQLAHLLSPAEDGGGWGVFDPKAADRCIFVGGIAWKWQEEDVRELFQGCGPIEEIVLGRPNKSPRQAVEGISDQPAGTHAGFAWIAFKTPEAVPPALRLDRSPVAGTNCLRLTVERFNSTKSPAPHRRGEQGKWLDCRHWLRGSCRLGASCSFLHAPGLKGVDNADSSKMHGRERTIGS